MNINKRKSVRIKYIVPVVILALCLFVFLITGDVLTEAEEISDPSDPILLVDHKSLTDDGASWIETYSNGSVRIHMRSKAAGDDTKIRYRTVAFAVSRSQAGSVSLTKDKVTYQGVAAPPNADDIPLTAGMLKEDRTQDGYNYSTWEFDQQYVKDALNDTLRDITGTTTLYLNAKFITYTLNSDRSKTDRKHADTWKEMMLAESWSTGSLEGFAKYYNMPIAYDPGPQPARIYHDYKTPGGVNG